MRASTPIHSVLTDEASLERLDAFIVSLGERIDTLQEAEQARDFDAVAKQARDLVQASIGLGLAPLAVAADRVAGFAEQLDADAVYHEIVELTDVVRRVRLGHRGGLP